MKLLRLGDFYGNRYEHTNREILMENGTSANIALNDNRGQMNKIGVNFFKSRQGQKMPSAQDRHFLPLPL